jgi:hypothetical protein
MRRLASAALSLVMVLALLGNSRAETTLTSTSDGWEVYATGRIGVFAEVLKGDGVPQAYGQVDMDNDPSTPPISVPIHPVGNGGIAAMSDPVLQPDGTYRQGPVLASRVRSGFLGNVFGFGVRRKLTESTVLTGHIAIWGTSETDSQRTFYRNYADWREGYISIEGPAGTLRAGRALSLFSRGAIEIDYLYAHQYGVGNPAGFSELGPSGGHIGYGVVAPVFVAGLSYATPRFHGLQLTAGYYDPGTLVGLYWTRTKLGRPEAEATYDLSFGSSGKLHLFVNGAFQKLYATDSPRNTNVYGVGGGGRIELGSFHLGAATHSGRGLGIGYFLDGSDAVVAQFTTQELRKFSGYYVQAQLAMGTFDLNAGWGMTRVYVLPADIDPNWCAASGGSQPCAGFDPMTNQPARSFLKSQTGYSGVFVYHFSSHLHFSLDYFLSDVRWQQGEKQLVHSMNIGSTLTW